MARIPSIQPTTNDFIFRQAVEKGSSLPDPDNPHLLVIDGFFNPSNASDEPLESLGAFHSLDVIVFRDGEQVDDVEVIIFHHHRCKMKCYYSLEFSDAGNTVFDHEYLVTVVLRYLP